MGPEGCAAIGLETTDDLLGTWALPWAAERAWPRWRFGRGRQATLGSGRRPEGTELVLTAAVPLASDHVKLDFSMTVVV